MSFFNQILGNSVKNISVSDLQQMLQDKPKDTVYIDVRTPDEFKLRHLDAFKNIPLDQLPNRLSEVPKDKDIVLICLSGGRSSSAARFLNKNGYDRLMNVTGGMSSVHFQ